MNRALNSEVHLCKPTIVFCNPLQVYSLGHPLYILRPKQKEILTYTHGKMGISAVPGSGKTFTLSFLTAELLKRRVVEEDQEILIVTLVNSAVDNFYNRISSFVQARGVFPNMGYRVRTLHGLAHDIVRERPDLVGLDSNFQIIDEREADSIRSDIAQAWLSSHPDQLEWYFNPELESEKKARVERENLPLLVNNIANNFIRYAKDHRFTPEHLKVQIDSIPIPYPLAQMGLEMYSNYQNALNYRGAVDFDDLIRLAVSALEWDPSLLQRLRYRWPYILEDEAQDSNLLQEEILNLLTGEDGNWVRVGDPNQAIYESFTTANPEFLMRFLTRPDVIRRELPNSGRSSPRLIDFANHLVLWNHAENPNTGLRDALQTSPLIEPAPADDPQPNPPDEESSIFVSMHRYNPAEEIQAVADSIERWLPNHPDSTVAVLAPRNQRAFELVDELRKRNLPYLDDLLRSSSTTRFSAGSLGYILRHLADPSSSSKLAMVYRVWKRDSRQNESEMIKVDQAAEILQKISHVENYIWPVADNDWLEISDLAATDPELYEELAQFRQLVRRWHQSVLLPIDQIVLTIAQDILTDPSELAIAHKLAVLLARTQVDHPDWRLIELSDELVVIAKNERRFLGFSESDTGFEPDRYKGKIVVSTMHKAKGLEWDKVYLMSLNNYDFPSAVRGDPYISEKWFIRDNLNIEAEALAQLEVLFSPGENQAYQEGVPSQEARLDYARERIRLLYVGITRAKKELVITWNTGRNKDSLPAIPILELYSYLEKQGQTEQ